MDRPDWVKENGSVLWDEVSLPLALEALKPFFSQANNLRSTDDVPDKENAIMVLVDTDKYHPKRTFRVLLSQRYRQIVYFDPNTMQHVQSILEPFMNAGQTPWMRKGGAPYEWFCFQTPLRNESAVSAVFLAAIRIIPYLTPKELFEYVADMQSSNPKYDFKRDRGKRVLKKLVKEASEQQIPFTSFTIKESDGNPVSLEITPHNIAARSIPTDIYQEIMKWHRPSSDMEEYAKRNAWRTIQKSASSVKAGAKRIPFREMLEMPSAEEFARQVRRLDHFTFVFHRNEGKYAAIQQAAFSMLELPVISDAFLSVRSITLHGPSTDSIQFMTWLGRLLASPQCQIGSVSVTGRSEKVASPSLAKDNEITLEEFSDNLAENTSIRSVVLHGEKPLVAAWLIGLNKREENLLRYFEFNDVTMAGYQRFFVYAPGVSREDYITKWPSVKSVLKNNSKSLKVIKIALPKIADIVIYQHQMMACASTFVDTSPLVAKLPVSLAHQTQNIWDLEIHLEFAKVGPYREGSFYHRLGNVNIAQLDPNAVSSYKYPSYGSGTELSFGIGY
jgi:hypothetical protein